MYLEEVFLYADLTPPDQLAFAKALQICLRTFKKNECWCLQRHSHQAFAGFTTVNPTRLLYKNRDARPLVLALSGQFQTDDKPLAVRKALCTSPYCLNPSHYYWGTKQDIAYESANRNGLIPSAEHIAQMRADKEKGQTSLHISRKYKLPYHVARRICNGEVYDQLAQIPEPANLEEFWGNTLANCKQLTSHYQKEARNYNLAIHVANKLECPWHNPGKPGHKGNFGLMGECLDCLQEIKNGRCSVDVTKFSPDWYWQVKRFWDQVDINDEDECWPWLGATRRDNSESIAYFPSPFHSGKTQSAPRVAFWLSRGYTGKYRVFARKTCKPFCCNPKHLSIREVKNLPEPTKIENICLHYGNIFDSYRKNLQQVESDLTDQLPLA
jgi:hypothetical protein